MMTSPIGNDLRKNSKRGFSFLEVMVAVMVLSGGLVSIYKSFFTSLDYTNHLTIRLQANILLDEKIATLNRLLQDQNQLTLVGPQAVDRVIIAEKPVNFQYTLDLRSVENLKGLFLLDVSIGWMEGNRRIQLLREAYLSSPKLIL
ncbi:MAG TPA: prepilin-type N-terminal cleavage/methylation domain-containing protein [Candidatus Omnitrophota bacterium]|nr:prepilin-type N-terminal cleavage/methylation domain-containing protein [Candidatus Omnitrophota bacterium]